jgi:hypothetical protein
MNVHVADPRRVAGLLLALALVIAVIAILYALTGAAEPVDVGRS